MFGFRSISKCLLYMWHNYCCIITPLNLFLITFVFKKYTINGERFAEPNFRGFEEDRESFSVNILHERLFNNYRYNISAPGR